LFSEYALSRDWEAHANQIVHCGDQEKARHEFGLTVEVKQTLAVFLGLAARFGGSEGPAYLTTAGSAVAPSGMFTDRACMPRQ
jgi:hypothetical protein